MQEYYIKLGQEQVFSHPFQFIIQYHLPLLYSTRKHYLVGEDWRLCHKWDYRVAWCCVVSCSSPRLCLVLGEDHTSLHLQR